MTLSLKVPPLPMESPGRQASKKKMSTPVEWDFESLVGYHRQLASLDAKLLPELSRVFVCLSFPGHLGLLLDTQLEEVTPETHPGAGFSNLSTTQSRETFIEYLVRT